MQTQDAGPGSITAAGKQQAVRGGLDPAQALASRCCLLCNHWGQMQSQSRAAFLSCLANSRSHSQPRAAPVIGCAQTQQEGHVRAAPPDLLVLKVNEKAPSGRPLPAKGCLCYLLVLRPNKKEPAGLAPPQTASHLLQGKAEDILSARQF